MDNLKSPAYPNIDSYENGNICTPQAGFSKLELASLMIAQGYVAHNGFQTPDKLLGEYCTQTAKAILEEATK